jgi:hypothetical protein
MACVVPVGSSCFMRCPQAGGHDGVYQQVAVVGQFFAGAMTLVSAVGDQGSTVWDSAR